MYWLVYAYIVDGIIRNLGAFDPNGAYTYANDFAKKSYGSNAIAVDVTDYPVAIGDAYRDGEFYHNGEKVERVSTVREDIETVYEALAELGELIGG